LNPRRATEQFFRSRSGRGMREHRIRKTKTVCAYCGVGCSFDVWTKDRHILKIAPEHVLRMAFYLHKGKVWLGISIVRTALLLTHPEENRFARPVGTKPSVWWRKLSELKPKMS